MPNARPGRDEFGYDVVGMDGIPDEDDMDPNKKQKTTTPSAPAPLPPGAPPPAPAPGQPPQGYGAPPPNPYGAPPGWPPQPYGGPPPGYGYGGPPRSPFPPPGYPGGPPPGYGGPPPGYGGPPPGYGGPPPGFHGAPPQGGPPPGYPGAPPPGYGAPPPGYGAPGGPPPGYGGPPPGMPPPGHQQVPSNPSNRCLACMMLGRPVGARGPFFLLRQCPALPRPRFADCLSPSCLPIPAPSPSQPAFPPIVRNLTALFRCRPRTAVLRPGCLPLPPPHPSLPPPRLQCLPRKARCCPRGREGPKFILCTMTRRCRWRRRGRCFRGIASTVPRRGTDVRVGLCPASRCGSAVLDSAWERLALVERAGRRGWVEGGMALVTAV